MKLFHFPSLSDGKINHFGWAHIQLLMIQFQKPTAFKCPYSVYFDYEKKQRIGENVVFSLNCLT